MDGLFETVERWKAAGLQLATATVVRTWRSSPRPVGSVMVVADDGQTWGSVSGGCVEGAIIEASQVVVQTGVPQVLEFGAVDPEQLWEIGLSCGGQIKVLVEPCPVTTEAWLRASSLDGTRHGYVWAVSTTPGRHRHAVFSADGGFDEQHEWAASARRAYESRTSTELDVGDETVFFDVRRPKDRLVIVGGVHIAIPLVRFAHDLGFETVVVEPRAAFAAESRFPTPPDTMLVDWPKAVLGGLHLDNDTYAVTLTHDPKIDDDALRILLKSDVRYIGALGSRTTQEERRDRLTNEGFTSDDLARIHGPIGLDIGALSPEEIALSIIAEIVQVKRARSA